MARFRRRPITFRDALDAAREIGVDELRGMSREDAAAAICASACKAKGINTGDPQIDWEGLLAFIERLLPLILAIVELFG